MRPLIGPHLFPSIMATEQEQNFQLTCLIEGDDNTFIITLPVTATVDKLRRGVHQLGGLDTLNVRVVAVNLWKVCPEIH
jgi:hypothetical protein